MIIFLLPGYTFIACLTKPVDIELGIIVVVIPGNERGCVALPTLAKDLWWGENETPMKQTTA